jgi:LuxR family maltose regulon positive regulatory protein
VSVLGLPPLLDDKLRVPRPTFPVLRRRRVVELVDSAVSHRVTLVSGPAGAGKTVACASWAATRPAARQPAWLTASAEDREPARFWQYLLAALVRVRAVGADDASQLATAPPEAYPLRIVAAVRRVSEPVVLVIDDVHELAGSGALAGLDMLIRHAPPGLRLVLSGRCPPGLALARLRVAGELADIGAADLACTTAEADAYLAMLGIGMTPAQRGGLLDRTEGWMAGLRLAAMAPQAGSAAPAAAGGVAGDGGDGLAGGTGGRLAENGGRSRRGAAGAHGVAAGGAGSVPGRLAEGLAGGTETVVIDYVRDEVLDRQSPDTRQFMLRTSVAARMSGDLADALTGEHGTGARTLERLTRENSMVELVGGSGAEYRYHPMLREVLAVELSRELPQEVPALLGRAARWHAARGEAIEAVRAAAQAGDWDFGAQVLAEAGAGVLVEAGAGGRAGAGAGVRAGGNAQAGGPGGDARAGRDAATGRNAGANRAAQAVRGGQAERGAQAAAGMQGGRGAWGKNGAEVLVGDGRRAPAGSHAWAADDAAGTAAAGTDAAGTDGRVPGRGGLRAAKGRPLSGGRSGARSAAARSAGARPRAGSAADLEAVLATFPAARRADDAPVAAAMAACRLWQGDPAGAAPHLACAQRSLARLDPGTRRAVEPWLAALQVMQHAGDADGGPAEPGENDQAGERADLARQWSRAERAEATAAAVPEYRAAGLLWFALGCARLRRWEIGAARHALARASAQLAAGSMPGMRARAMAWQALAAAQYGDLAAADRLMTEVASGPAGWRPEAACPLALAGAQVSVARDEIDAARRLLDEADRNAGGELAGEPSVAVISGLIRAHCAGAESDTAAAHSILLRLREAHAVNDRPLGELLTVLEARVALAAGEPAQASLLLGGDPAALRWARPQGELGHARLRLAAGDDAGALQAAEGCRTGAAQDVTLRDRVAALLITAVAQRRLGQVAAAAEAIEQALVLAEPGGGYRVFLDGGPSVRSAMTVLVPPTSRCAGFAGRILERFDGQLPRFAGAAGQADLPLTASELAVLRFLPSHMTNQEIAEALFLSINTVKTHLRSAYRKLGVANRRQAIARGRRLELL